ncbi:hypothetical protein LHU53_15605 [Rhodoferax sp. U2-2l]|uniref:hypothetical protein n=1 Tax=Rhodoferax sp. U2-2l TaxID=2884000 RepID=UPI001D0AF883|nr:hypothetical protein [Rhodoferax sp. U2-2l]MCB8748326.1 hypothetical protein [Rhodoferax sp. U2-2l]
MPHGLPPQIEIFRAGRHTDDSGAVHEFSPADVAGMASSYDPALREAPLTVGHPADNLPAYGWVKGVAVNADGRLAMDTRDVHPQFAEMVQARRFPKRSASFYPPQHPNNPKPGHWYLRHVAFLGAQPPAIAGLRDISFAEEAAGTVNFSEATQPPQPTQEQIQMDKELEAKLAAEQQKNAELQAAADKAKADAAAAQAQLAQFAEAARAERTASFTNYAEAQVKAAIVKPSEKAAVVDLLNLAADAKAVSFSEGGAVRTVPVVDFVKSLIERAKPAVSFSEQAAGGAGASSAAGLSDAEIDAKAKAHALQHKVSYAEALSAVCSFTGAA